MNMLPIMEELAEPENDIIDGILYMVKDADKNTTIEWIRTRSLLMIADAEKVNKEIDKFIESLDKGDEIIEKEMENYPFLAEVWYGDVYDEQGIGAIKALLEEFNTLLLQTNDNYLIKKAIEHLHITTSKEYKK
jgi:hypothetical protein